MSSKTKYMTALSIVALTLTCCFAIPSIALGLNIARNYSSIGRYYIYYAPEEFHLSSFYLSESDRINIDIRSTLWNNTMYDMPIVFSIMDDETFNEWVILGELEPSILNSTYYTKSSEIDIRNLNLNLYSSDRLYHFIIYNQNLDSVRLEIDIEIIPWSSIIGTCITGFLFSLFFLIFITKILSAAYNNGIITIKDRKRSKSPNISRSSSISESKNKEIKGQFCQSCGAPITPKDGQYCPNCGASI